MWREAENVLGRMVDFAAKPVAETPMPQNRGRQRMCTDGVRRRKKLVGRDVDGRMYLLSEHLVHLRCHDRCLLVGGVGDTGRVHVLDVCLRGLHVLVDRGACHVVCAMLRRNV